MFEGWKGCRRVEEENIGACWVARDQRCRMQNKLGRNEVAGWAERIRREADVGQGQRGSAGFNVAGRSHVSAGIRTNERTR